MEAKEINWKEVKNRSYFKCIINGIETSGRIEKQGDSIYLCQNDIDGGEPNNKLGYQFGWCIGMGAERNLISCSVSNLEVSATKFKGMVVPNVPNILYITKKNTSYPLLVDSTHVRVDGGDYDYHKIKKIYGEFGKAVLYQEELKSLLNKTLYPEIKWDKVKVGAWFVGKIDGRTCLGQIQKHNDIIYLCQDIECDEEIEDIVDAVFTNKFAHRFAYEIGKGTKRSMANWSVQRLKIYETRPKFKIEPDIKSIVGNHHSLSFSDGKLNGGCQIITIKKFEQVIRLMDKLRAKELKALKKDLVVK